MRLALLLFFLLTHSLQAQLYKTYQKPRRFSATAELGGINPIIAANIEYNPLQVGRCFLTLRLGVGHMLTKYSINTFPMLPQ
ncbi:hypothetical protein [Tellurirhabdus bombi]|uniref:hypothetical protein n=1 Tax=Tellurirhabdus bombi TaxID=2907205 RepID=UPI001F43873F|nr:hypothetical protein [Tellurirhabdus bombi]